MKIMPLSDLHYMHFLGKKKVDFYPSYINPDHYSNTDIVVVAGDIENYPLTQLLPDNGHVVYVEGNHDKWVGCETKPFNHPRIHRLDNSSIEINGVVFVGCTLWTAIRTDMGFRTNRVLNSVRKYMNDFVEIPGFTLEKWISLHEESVSYLTKAIKKAKSEGKKVVVVTHHAPSYKSKHPDYNFTDINAAYYSELDLCHADLWIHGHTHESSDYLKDGTRVVCNPYGYYGLTGTNPNFNHILQLDLERLDRYG